MLHQTTGYTPINNNVQQQSAVRDDRPVRITDQLSFDYVGSGRGQYTRLAVL